jgi:hypothetical protein
LSMAILSDSRSSSRHIPLAAVSYRYDETI